MKNILTVSGIQTDIIWNNPKLNFAKYEKIIKNLFDSQIIILPEMFDTGFVVGDEILKNRLHDSIFWLQDMSKKYNTAICGSTAYNLGNNKLANRFIFMEPNGELKFYDKRHLFSISGENELYVTGNNQLVINYLNWKIFPQICYDLRFPVWSRNVFDYHLIIYVANWPCSRIEQWITLLKARAIENQSFVVAVNRTGKDNNGFEYCGNSLVINYKGEIIYNAGSDELMFTIDLDLAELKDAREKFPVLKDKDKFKIL